MAGPETTHRASHAIFQRIQDAFHRRQLVEASVDILGHSFRTSIREGASTEELIEKVAKENGGGVARVYYPEFKTWEIVAVKIGDQLLVKGDPKRVGEADFSQFSEPEAVREAALISSRKSDGGIHFSIGSSGIPLAVTPDQGIVFPNAEELRIGKATRNISLWMTSVNINPRSMADLDRAYSGGVSVSQDALKKIAESHGGVRSDRLLLDDNILVLNKDTGEILTGAQHAMRMESYPVPAEHQMPPAILAPDTPALPFDGSVARAHFLSFRVFDGSLSDQVRVQFSPLPQQAPAPKLPAPSTPETAKSRERETGKPSPPRFSIIEFSSLIQPAASVEAAREKRIAGKAPERENTAQSSGPARQEPLPSAEMILRSWLKSRKPPAALGVPDSVLPVSAAEAPRPRRRKKRYHLGPSESRGFDAPAPIAPKAEKARRPSVTRKKTEMRSTAPGQKAPAMKQKKPDSRLKPGPARAEKAQRAGKAKSIRLPELKMAARKMLKIKEKIRKKLAVNDSGNRKIPKAPGHAVSATAILSKKESSARLSPSVSRKRAKRKMARHFFYDMMGLFQRKRRGRKFNTKNARAE